VVEGSISFVGRIGAAFSRVIGGVADNMPVISAAVVVLVITWIAGRLTFVATQRVLSRRSTEAHVDVLVARYARAAVVILGIVVALAVAGVNVTALAASVGLVGVTLGLALKDVLANSVSGVLLLLQRPFGIGDSIAVAGVEGVVEDIRVRDTVLRASDGRRAYVPNTTVFNEVVVNSSHDSLRRFEIALSVSSDADVTAAAARIAEAVSGVAGVLPQPAADAAPAAIGSVRTRIVAHGWVDTRDTSVDETRAAALTAAAAALAQEARS